MEVEMQMLCRQKYYHVEVQKKIGADYVCYLSPLSPNNVKTFFEKFTLFSMKLAKCLGVVR